MSMTSSRPRHLSTRTLAVTLLALVALGACSTAEQSKRDDTGAITERNDNASVFEMKVGDCYEAVADGEEVDTLPAVPCTDPHDTEVYLSHTIEGDDFPGAAEVDQLAQDVCADAFGDFVGISYDDSELEMFYFTPTTLSWDQGDDQITCLVAEPEEKKATGTLEGAKR